MKPTEQLIEEGWEKRVDKFCEENHIKHLNCEQSNAHLDLEN